jgi:hypothetical protein
VEVGNGKRYNGSKKKKQKVTHICRSKKKEVATYFILHFLGGGYLHFPLDFFIACLGISKQGE